MRVRKRRGFSLAMVLVILLIGGVLVTTAFQIVESKTRLGFLAKERQEIYNQGISALEKGKTWLHRYIVTYGSFPEKIRPGAPVRSSDLVVHRGDDHVVCDLLYQLPASMDASMAGFPKWKLSTYGGSIAVGDYPSANAGISQGKGEGPEGTGVFLIRSVQKGGRGYEVVVSEGK